MGLVAREERVCEQLHAVLDLELFARALVQPAARREHGHACNRRRRQGPRATLNPERAWRREDWRVCQLRGAQPSPQCETRRPRRPHSHGASCRRCSVNGACKACCQPFSSPCALQPLGLLAAGRRRCHRCCLRIRDAAQPAERPPRVIRYTTASHVTARLPGCNPPELDERPLPVKTRILGASSANASSLRSASWCLRKVPPALEVKQRRRSWLTTVVRS